MNETNTYFNLMIESTRTARLFTSSLRRYLVSENINCNEFQAIMVYLIKRHGGTNVSQNNIQKYLKYISTNGSYNFSALAKSGYITSTLGALSDYRCAFLTLTEKGNLLYDKIVEYAKNQIQHMEEGIDWDSKNSNRFLNDLDALQSFLGTE